MLEIVLLGPVEIRQDGVALPMAPLERNLLAVLALSFGRVLSTERIIDHLWGERPPAAPRSRVQGLVSSLRRKVGGALVTRQPGYLLNLPDGGCDLDNCETLAEGSRAAETPRESAQRLREALALWRGDPLDGVFAPGLDAERARLSELRISLLESRFEADLELGRHTELVGELVAAVLANPLRERLAGQLMLALYRSNRAADALRTYQSLRERLAEELGSDPSADLNRLHAMILRGEDPPHAPPLPSKHDAIDDCHRPAQMPASVGHFSGREADLAALTAALPEPGDEPRVLVVSGAGGLGKTALVVRWAHAVADRFPDGQIFVDLRGSGKGTPVSMGSALGTVLLALGVAAEQLPVSSEERAAMYRTLMHHRKVLLVADDAGVFGQLLPLVPPTSGSVVVATSRSRLSALTAHHAVRTLIIEPLGGSASHDLLRAIVGADRWCGDGTDAVVSLCGGWPLALRLAGVTLAARPGQSPASFARELRERVELLSIADDPRTVAAALAHTVAGLEAATARLFAQLGLLPGATVCLQLAAATAGTSLLRTRSLLDELISANLVVETGPDRYRLHDMIRRYARRCGAALTDRTVVEHRIIRWYLAVFGTLAHRGEPGLGRPLPIGQPEWSPLDEEGVADFMEAETPNLPAVIGWADSRADPELTWRLVSMAHAAGVKVPVQLCELGLEAAVKLNDQTVLAEAHARLGIALLPDPARRHEADEHLSAAVVLMEPGDGRLPGLASFAVGGLRAGQGRTGEAVAALENTLRQLDPGREPLSYSVVLLGYAELLVASGSVDRGHERFAQAVILREAIAGGQDERFERGGSRLDARLAAAYLSRLSRSLDAPRVSAPDHGLANTLIGISRVLRTRRNTGAGMAIPLQRIGRTPERDMALPRLDAAEPYRI